MLRRLIVLFLALLPISVLAQVCPQAPVLTPSKEANLFNEEQESQLGDIFAEQLSYSLRVIEDPEVRAYLDKVGQRLLAEMPPSTFKFRFYVVDSPEANAFAIAGGRVYVTRKLITTVKSEDELAGVMAHELGHQLAHHSALDWSRVFRDVLHVTKVGDRADIENKYNEILDTYRTKQDAIRAAMRTDHEQTGADQVGVYALARAGYAPQAIVDFWDRFAETQGKKGSWLSDFFGTGWPESKRLRDMVKNLEAISPQCKEAARRPSGDDFLRWQTIVKSYSGFGKKEALHNVVLKRSLSPILRGDIENFRFSPDGKYLLAQDGGNIFVLRRDPLEVVFHIPAENAEQAQFSPDSRSVVFYNESLRVEVWNVMEHHVEDVYEPYVFRGCVQTALSPDGDFLVCMRPNRQTYFPLDLELIDVVNSKSVLTKKGFVGPQEFGYNTLQNYLMLNFGSRRKVLEMSFSPDGRYFVAGRNNAHLLVDLKSRAEVPMPGPLKKVTSYNFAFVGPDRLIGTENAAGEMATVVKFPSGEVAIPDVPVGGRSLSPASRGDYVIVRPLAKAPVGIMDLKTKKITIASKTDALDIYDGQFVSERVNGELGVYGEAGKPPLATAQLPRAPLANVSAAIASPDLTHVALSERARGAVWDLNSGERLLYVRGFRGAWFDQSGVLLDFAPADQYGSVALKDEKADEVRKREGQQPGDSVAKADLATRTIVPVTEVLKRTHVRQFANTVLTWAPKDDDKPRKDVTMEARDASSGSTLWKREFPDGAPSVNGSADNDYLVFSWYLGTGGAKEELKNDPAAKKLVDALTETEGSYLVEVVQPQSGKVVAKFPIATSRASFRSRMLRATADTLMMVDDNHRVLLYSFKGENKGRLFGGYAVLSRDGKKLCVESEPGRVRVFDAATLRELHEFTFGSQIVTANFAADGKRLLILTDDETAVVLDVAAKADPTAVSTK